MACGGDFSGDHGQAGGDQRFAGHAALGVLRDHCVEDRVGNLVGDLVRVSFGHRFRRKQKIS